MNGEIVYSEINKPYLVGGFLIERVLLLLLSTCHLNFGQLMRNCNTSYIVMVPFTHWAV